MTHRSREPCGGVKQINEQQMGFKDGQNICWNRPLVGRKRHVDCHQYKTHNYCQRFAKSTCTGIIFQICLFAQTQLDFPEARTQILLSTSVDPCILPLTVDAMNLRPQVNNPKYYSVFLLEKLASSSIKNNNHISYSVGAFAIVELSSGLFVEMYGLSLSTD